MSYVDTVAVTPYIDYCYCRRDGSLVSRIYQFEQELYAYTQSILVADRFLNLQNLKDTKYKTLIYSIVADFANRVLNSIYTSTDRTYQERMSLLHQIDISLIGKYAHPVNMKEWVIKSLLMLKMIRIHDFLRTFKLKIHQ